MPEELREPGDRLSLAYGSRGQAGTNRTRKEAMSHVAVLTYLPPAGLTPISVRVYGGFAGTCGPGSLDAEPVAALESRLYGPKLAQSIRHMGVCRGSKRLSPEAD